MDVNEHERLSNITLRQIKVKEQLVVRKDTDVNKHERLSEADLEGTCGACPPLKFVKHMLYNVNY